MTDRCEPPEHLRDVDGWHWLVRGEAEPIALHWQPNRAGQDSEWGLGYFSPSAAYTAGYRYLAPVTPPDVVAAMVEALIECADDLEQEVRERHPPYMAGYPEQHRKLARDLEPVVKARAALARYHAAMLGEGV